MRPHPLGRHSSENVLAWRQIAHDWLHRCPEAFMLLVSKLKLTCSPGAVPLDVAIEPNFDFLSAEYQSLHRRSQTTAFQDPRWLHALYRDVVPRLKADPFIVV